LEIEKMAKAKRLTKKQKLEQEKVLLHKRITDIVCGVTGGENVLNHPDDFYMSVEYLTRLLPALKATFDIGDTYETKNLLVFDWNLDKYETVDGIVEFYFDNGVRA
jgi:hypothetical protein